MSNEWRARRRPHNYVRYRAETGEDYGGDTDKEPEGKLRRESGRAGRAGGSVEKRPLERAAGVGGEGYQSGFSLLSHVVFFHSPASRPWLAFPSTPFLPGFLPGLFLSSR